MMKIICAGLCKTGTKSMREAFRILGYENTHDVYEQAAYDYQVLKKALIDQTAKQQDFQEAFNDVDAITDIPGFYIWRELMEAFPDAKVVLTVRGNLEEWAKSFQNMVDVERKNVFYFKYFRLLKFLFCNDLCPSLKQYVQLREAGLKRLCNCDGGWNNFSLQYAKEQYQKHNEEVKGHCPPDRLLVFNVQEGWESLCRFLGNDVPKVPFPRKNVRHSIAFESLHTIQAYDAGMTKAIPNEMNRAVAIYTSFLAVFVYFMTFLLT